MLCRLYTIGLQLASLSHLVPNNYANPTPKDIKLHNIISSLLLLSRRLRIEKTNFELSALFFAEIRVNESHVDLSADVGLRITSQ